MFTAPLPLLVKQSVPIGPHRSRGFFSLRTVELSKEFRDYTHCFCNRRCSVADAVSATSTGFVKLEVSKARQAILLSHHSRGEPFVVLGQLQGPSVVT